MDTMIEIPALRPMAELAPNSADTDARTVEVIWSAGARVRRSTLFGEPRGKGSGFMAARIRSDFMIGSQHQLGLHAKLSRAARVTLPNVSLESSPEMIA